MGAYLMVDETIGNCHADNCNIGRKFYDYHICKDFEWMENPPAQVESCCGVCAYWQEDEGVPASIGYCTRIQEKEDKPDG